MSDANGGVGRSDRVANQARGPSNRSSNGSSSGLGPGQEPPVEIIYVMARLDSFILRNTPHLFGVGAVQVLAEEMTEELQGIRNSAELEACETGNAVIRTLFTKGTDYGAIRVIPVVDGIGPIANGIDPKGGADQQSLIEFLENLVLFKQPEP